MVEERNRANKLREEGIAAKRRAEAEEKGESPDMGDMGEGGGWSRGTGKVERPIESSPEKREDRRRPPPEDIGFARSTMTRKTDDNKESPKKDAGPGFARGPPRREDTGTGGAGGFRSAGGAEGAGGAGGGFSRGDFKTRGKAAEE